MLNINMRKAHRLLVPLAAIPLLLTAISGSLFAALDSRGMEVMWLLRVHTGDFGIVNLGPYYAVLLGSCTIAVTASGLALLRPKGKRRQEQPL